ncbi:hypothetical protein W97_07716 [Coniosporium apollinis CBS 100218]|uniref:Protein kinase domain-containing protein n=1 Tax=Coniosporium apollinis (strain CBS 100218) TaxID=1168221 RepID=R7Z2J7_CONA1|nr:uncharacterized protein W97_07716 [Coniosporium apollinis CBS 100218]EON68392.1 hypothetical protein W97_07716 [Coniosporium apollinis CBS 100218]
MDVVAQRLATTSFRSRSADIISVFPSFSPTTSSVDVPGQCNVFLCLERERFVEWVKEFEKLIQTASPNIVHDQLNQILETFTILQERLRQLEMTGQPLDPSVESRIPALVQEVCNLIDSLQIKLSSDQQQTVERSWTDIVMAIDDMNILYAIRSAAAPARYRSVGIKTAMKYMAKAITKARRSRTSQMIVERGLVEVDPDYPGATMRRFNSDALRNVGTYDDRRVLIEWTRYDAVWKGKIGEEMYARLEAQAKFLNSDETPRVNLLKERALECLGYFHDERYYRFGFVYAIPATTIGLDEDKTISYTLYNYIRDSRPSRSNDSLQKMQRPFLGDLFTLAKGLAGSLNTLHGIGWLHKGICSENILIFTPGNANAHQHVSCAVLAGSYQSRPEESEYSVGTAREFELYEHPLYRNRAHGNTKFAFKRTFNFFSLGIVLLEIGLWCSVSQILSDHTDCRMDDSGTESDENDDGDKPTMPNAEDCRQMLLESYVPQLGETMGKEYMLAVRFCLDAEAILGSPGNYIEDRKLSAHEFKSQVLDHLAICSA